MQRKMVRFVRGLDWREHVGEADVWTLGWMPFHRRVEFFKAVHVFKVQKSAAPAYISCNFNRVSSVHSHTLRQSDRNFSLSSCSFPPKSFTYSAIVFWNSLPLQLKATESFHPFKKGLTAFLRRDWFYGHQNQFWFLLLFFNPILPEWTPMEISHLIRLFWTIHSSITTCLSSCIHAYWKYNLI